MDRNRIIQAAQHFVGKSDMDDGELVNHLYSKGFGLEESERLVAFLPIAFARVVIAHMAKVSFTTDYRIEETGSVASLSDEPIFIEAIKLATESYHNGIVARELFSALASRSPELGAVNKALNEGVDINGATFQTVKFFGYKSFGRKGWLKRIFG